MRGQKRAKKEQMGVEEKEGKEGKEGNEGKEGKEMEEELSALSHRVVQTHIPIDATAITSAPTATITTPTTSSSSSSSTPSSSVAPPSSPSSSSSPSTFGLTKPAVFIADYAAHAQSTPYVPLEENEELEIRDPSSSSSSLADSLALDTGVGVDGALYHVPATIVFCNTVPSCRAVEMALSEVPCPAS